MTRGNLTITSSGYCLYKDASFPVFFSLSVDGVKMEKKLTLLQTVFTAGVFSAVSFWYGFMFGRESARKELGDLIEDLRRPGDAGGGEAAPHSEH
ncbi:hypothetical protein Taro_008261 [Colocasia esculenta]|uniref:Uncharacterized protein n=1 Tax=Colocasia esculenta TaxID=4460 RepID=A0A843TWM1_COLES|nr:hypothetical protein [Colocasia esculenta]